AQAGQFRLKRANAGIRPLPLSLRLLPSGLRPSRIGGTGIMYLLEGREQLPRLVAEAEQHPVYLQGKSEHLTDQDSPCPARPAHPASLSVPMIAGKLLTVVAQRIEDHVLPRPRQPIKSRLVAGVPSYRLRGYHLQYKGGKAALGDHVERVAKARWGVGREHVGRHLTNLPIHLGEAYRQFAAD